MDTIDLESIASLPNATAPPSLSPNRESTTTQNLYSDPSVGIERASRDSYVMIVDDETTNIELVQW